MSYILEDKDFSKLLKHSNWQLKSKMSSPISWEIEMGELHDDQLLNAIFIELYLRQLRGRYNIIFTA